MHFFLYKRHVLHRLFHCHDMKLKLDTKVSLLVVLLAIAVCTASTAADGQKSADPPPPTSDTSNNKSSGSQTQSGTAPASQKENDTPQSAEVSAEEKEINDAVDRAIEEQVRQGISDELSKRKEDKERRIQAALAARLEEVKQRIQAEVRAKLDADPPRSAQVPAQVTKTPKIDDNLTPGDYLKQREDTWTWADMFGFSERPADSATPTSSAETKPNKDGSANPTITVTTPSYFDRVRTEIPNWFGIFFESLNKTGDKLYKMLEKAAEAVKKPHTDQRSEAVLFLVGCLILFNVLEWATKTYHAKFQLARKGDNDVYDMTGGNHVSHQQSP